MESSKNICAFNPIKMERKPKLMNYKQKLNFHLESLFDDGFKGEKP